MKRVSVFFLCFFILTACVNTQEKEIKLKIVQTSDIHGNF